MSLAKFVKKGIESLSAWQVGCSLLIGSGLVGLAWYERMTQEEKAEADALAKGIAKDLYQKGLNELADDERQHVQALVKARVAA